MILLAFWPLLVLTYAQAEELDEYVYDDTAAEEAGKNSIGGHRLVGASKGNTEEFPFVIGYNMKESSSDYTACTGSLITPSWMVSAAHCILAEVDTKSLKQCDEDTKSKGSFTFVPTNLRENKVVKCKITKSGDILIYPVSTKSTAYFGVVDVNNKQEVSSGLKIEIDFFVRHSESYQGGGSYGSHGGYDITLLHLATPAPSKYTPACLPSPKFKDTGLGPGYNTKEDGILAGYGRYYRTACMTDQYGPSKYHYCGPFSSCNQNDPPPTDPVCEEFFKDPSTPKAIANKDEEVIILKKDSKGGTIGHFCFRKESPELGSKGWCKIEKNAYDPVDLKPTNSWGFCSKDCFLRETNQANDAVLRRKHGIDILDEDLCSQYLKLSLGSVRVKPEILCIGHLKKVKYSAWNLSNGVYKPVQNVNLANLNHPVSVFRGGDTYVHSAGTCNGDSGGPVFTKHEKTGKYVVLGAVSGGRGRLGDCGGINNPTHYVRLKKFVKWIINSLGEDKKDLCFVP